MLGILTATAALTWLGPPVQRPSETVPLRWEAPAGCPDEGELRDRVEVLVPGALDKRDGQQSRIDARVEAGDRGFEATVTIAGAGGERVRSLSSDECEILADAVALVVSVALDPVLSAEQLRDRGPSPGEGEPGEVEPEPAPDEGAGKPHEPDEPDAPAPPEPPPVDRARTPPRVALRAFGAGAYGPTSQAHAGIGGVAALFGRRWRAELAVAWSIPRIVRTEVGGGTFDGWTLGARGCYVPALGKEFRVEFPVCPYAEIGQVRGRGLSNLPVSLEASFPWVALGLAQGLWFVPVKRFAFGFELSLGAALTRGAFVIEGQTIEELAPFGFRGLFGLELRVP